MTFYESINIPGNKDVYFFTYGSDYKFYPMFNLSQPLIESTNKKKPQPVCLKASEAHLECVRFLFLAVKKNYKFNHQTSYSGEEFENAFPKTLYEVVMHPYILTENNGRSRYQPRVCLRNGVPDYLASRSMKNDEN